MSHEVFWGQEYKSLYRKFSGKISGDEILKSNFELQAHPNFESIKYIINDFTDVTDHTVEIIHTNVYANTDNIASNVKGKLKIALIVPANSPVIELAYHYRDQMVGSLFSCEIFSNIEESNHWVGKA